MKTTEFRCTAKTTAVVTMTGLVNDERQLNQCSIFGNLAVVSGPGKRWFVWMSISVVIRKGVFYICTCQGPTRFAQHPRTLVTGSSKVVFTDTLSPRLVRSSPVSSIQHYGRWWRCPYDRGRAYFHGIYQSWSSGRIRIHSSHSAWRAGGLIITACSTRSIDSGHDQDQVVTLTLQRLTR